MLVSSWWAVSRCGGSSSYLAIWSPGSCRPLAVRGLGRVRPDVGDERRLEWLGGYSLWEHLWASMRRILSAAAWPSSSASPSGCCWARVACSRTLLEPGVTFIRALPPLAYFYLLVIWFGIDETPKVLLLVLAALPPIVLATSDAVRNVSQDRLLALRDARCVKVPDRAPRRVSLRAAGGDHRHPRGRAVRLHDGRRRRDHQRRAGYRRRGPRRPALTTRPTS